jgi:uncharacterized lipoprotein YbaY
MTKRTLIRGIKPGLGLLALVLGFGAMEFGQPARAQMEAEWHNCLTREVFSPAKQAWCNRWETIQNGTYLVPTIGVQDSMYTEITLTNGHYGAEEGWGVALANEPGWMAFGDLNGDNKDDAAVILGVISEDGTALSTYVVTLMDIDGVAQALNPVPLGERIMMNGPMSIADQRLLVSQLTQTEVINRTFVADGGTLSELAQLPTPEQAPGGALDGTLVFTNTSTYAVRVFTQDNQPYLNLFNHRTGRLEVDGGQVVVISSVGGIQYRYSGTGEVSSVQISLAPDGAQTFEVNNVEQTDLATVTGTVTYRPRIALPPNAVLEVQLVDVSLADAPAIVLSSQSIVTGGRQVPIPFELIYNPDKIDPPMTYAVQARITVDGELQFINTRRFSVISQGNPNRIEVVVDPVRR